MRRSAGWVAVSLAVLLAASCSGSENSDRSAETEAQLAQALRSLEEGDLALMVLPAEELGGEAMGLEIHADSGPSDNARTADDTTDPEDTAADLERAGRIGGYELSYGDADFSTLTAGEGVIQVGTGVDLFEDATGASAFIAKQVGDYERLAGKELGAGVSLARSQTLTVSRIGQEAVGIRAQISLAEARVYRTTVAFRFHRLVGRVFLLRADDADVTARTHEIARVLERRIQAVIRGDVARRPVPLPKREEAETEPTPAPAGAPDLAAMALGLDDLPAGISVAEEGFLEDERARATAFEREFALGTARIGSSELNSFESNVALFPTAAEAARLVDVIEAAASGDAATLFADSIAASAGFEVRQMRVELVSTPGSDGELMALHASFVTPLGPFEAFFFFFQVDRAVGSLFAAGQQGKIALPDLAPLARAAAERMATELASPP